MLELQLETIPDFPALKPLSAEDRHYLSDCIGRAGAKTCDLALANLYIWRDCEAPSLTRVGDSLCIRLDPHSGAPYFLPPLGGRDAVAAVRSCLSHTALISRVDADLVSRLPEHEFDIRPLRDYSDYVYSVEALSDLKGKKFDGKRNQIRKFAASVPGYEFTAFGAGAAADAMSLFDSWTETRESKPGTDSAGHPGSHICQRNALARAFQDFETLSLIGGAIVLEGAMKAFLIASRGAPGTAVVHFSYADTRFPGIYQTLLWEGCRRLLAGFTCLNLEEDLGVPGLRKTKLSYQPLRMEEKYEIRPRRTTPGTAVPVPAQ
jgi:uncharacterized protein